MVLFSKESSKTTLLIDFRLTSGEEQVCRGFYERPKGERRTKVMNNDSTSNPIRISKNRLSRILLLAIMIESAGVLLLVISFVWLWKGRKSMKHYQELRQTFKLIHFKSYLLSTNLKAFLRKRNSYIFLKELMKNFDADSITLNSDLD